MDDPAEALVAAHGSIRKTNTMPSSTHDNTGDICADEGRTEEVHNRTGSHTPESNATQTPTTKRFRTFAVNTGLTDSPGLPPELRLRVYKAAFPEMDRPVVDEEPQHIEDEKRVFIRQFINCWGDSVTEQCEGCCHCGQIGWNNRLQEAFVSNFARDPTIRVEFLTEYLRRVRIYNQAEEHTINSKVDLGLWRFLSILATSGLVGEMKHLTLEIEPTATSWAYPHEYVDLYEPYIGHTLAVLFRFRVKCELSFMVSPTYKPILDRIAEIVKASLSRDEIDKYFTSSCSDPYHHKYFTETNKLFGEDAVLLELIDGVEPYSDSDFLMKYPVDFSG